MFSKPTAADVLYLGMVNPQFPHMTILQQTTLIIFCQKIENVYNRMNNLKVENIVAKGEIAHYVFKKPSAAEVRKRLYEGKS